TAMSKIAAKITGTCTLTLDHVPPDPGLLNVYLDGQPLPQAGPDGWTLNGTIVFILGASCQKILAGDVLSVQVVAGCPTVTQ
ncbi:MAG TPA: VWA domain-containing protein, partial [Polyangiaceae bacterium]